MTGNNEQHQTAHIWPQSRIWHLAGLWTLLLTQATTRVPETAPAVENDTSETAVQAQGQTWGVSYIQADLTRPTTTNRAADGS